MDQEFIKLFEPFSIDLTILNYKSKTGAKLNDQDQKKIEIMRLLIPIYNRMIEEGNTINIDDVVKKESVQQTTHHQTINLQIDTDSDGYACNDDENDETEEDEEGDNQINALTEKSLDMLNKLIEESWAKVQNDDASDPDIDIVENEVAPQLVVAL